MIEQIGHMTMVYGELFAFSTIHKSDDDINIVVKLQYGPTGHLKDYGIYKASTLGEVLMWQASTLETIEEQKHEITANLKSNLASV